MTAGKSSLQLELSLPLEASNGGFFVSRGKGQHPTRVIGSYELIFVSSGALELHEAGRNFTVRAGEALILWPGREHGGVASYPANLSFYWLHFYLQRQGAASHCDLALPQHTALSRPDHLTSLFRRFLDDQETLAAQPAAASLLVLLMLSELVSVHTPQVALESSAALLAGRANALIRTQFHKPLSTSRLARALHCNPDYLGRVFHQFYGYTLTEAVHQRRVKQARKLLLDSSHTVERIATDCGFSDVGYFRRVFKRSEGMTPYTFRKLYSKMHINTE